MKLRKRKILALGTTALFMGAPLLALGQYWPDRGIGAAGLDDTPVVDIVETIMLWLLMIFTYIAVIGFVVSGVMYITAGGSGRAEEAKKWMVYSIIGTAIGISGYVIVRLVTDTVSGIVN